MSAVLPRPVRWFYFLRLTNSAELLSQGAVSITGITLSFTYSFLHLIYLILTRRGTGLYWLYHLPSLYVPTHLPPPPFPHPATLRGRRIVPRRRRYHRPLPWPPRHQRMRRYPLALRLLLFRSSLRSYRAAVRGRGRPGTRLGVTAAPRRCFWC